MVHIHHLASPESRLVTTSENFVDCAKCNSISQSEIQARRNAFFSTFFGRFFGAARVSMSYRIVLRRDFFCNVAKVCACVAMTILTRAPQAVRIWIRIRAKKRKNVKKKQVFVRISVA